MCMSVRHRKRQRQNSGVIVRLYCLLLYVRVCGRAGVRACGRAGVRVCGCAGVSVHVRVLCVYVCVRACVHWSKASKHGENFLLMFSCLGGDFHFPFFFCRPIPGTKHLFRKRRSRKKKERRSRKKIDFPCRVYFWP
jgi:hypothetical protein